MSWPKAGEASGSRPPGAQWSTAGSVCVAELTSGRGLIDAELPDKSFFAPVCAVMAARQISPISVPHEAVFCTEVMLHSLGRGLGFLEQVPMCCSSSSSSSWGHISSQSSGVLPSQGVFSPAGRVDAHPQPGLAGRWWYVLGLAAPTQLLRCCEIGPVCPPSLPPSLCYS